MRFIYFLTNINFGIFVVNKYKSIYHIQVTQRIWLTFRLWMGTRKTFFSNVFSFLDDWIKHNIFYFIKKCSVVTLFYICYKVLHYLCLAYDSFSFLFHLLYFNVKNLHDVFAMYFSFTFIFYFIFYTLSFYFCISSILYANYYFLLRDSKWYNYCFLLSQIVTCINYHLFLYAGIH